MAWTYDYIPTTLDEQLHAVDQYGIRIQRTTRPPYIHPEQWMKTKGAARDRMLRDFDKGAKELKELRARISDLEDELSEYHARGGVRRVGERRDSESPAAATVDVRRSPSPACDTETGGGSAMLDVGGARGDSFSACAAHSESGNIGVAMPVTPQLHVHRERDDPSVPYFYACTARTVDKTERSWNAEARAALKKEWDRLRSCGDKGCWDEANPRERNDVENEARKKKRTHISG